MPTRTLFQLSRLSGMNALVRRSLRESVLVLGYHGVVSRWHGDDQYAYRNTVSSSEFDYQLGVIGRLFNPIGVADWIDALNRGTRLPERSVMVTFDDGYRNNLTNAAPLLERHGIPALINVCTGYVGSGQPLWTEEVVHRIVHWPLAMLPMPGDEPSRPIAEDRRTRMIVAHRVRERCKQICDAERRTYLDRLRDVPLGGLSTDDEDRLAFLDWDEVRALSRRGFDIGSHSVDHPILARLAPEGLVYQMEESRAAIEREIGRDCLCIAYPNGQTVDVSPEVESAAARAGYRLGLMGTNRFNPAAANLLALSRVGIPGHVPRDVFHARISGLHDLQQRLADRLNPTSRTLPAKLRAGPDIARSDRSQPGFETKLLTRFDELEVLAAEWDRLWTSNPKAEVFLKFGWVRAWWRAYGAQRSLCAPAIFEQGRLVGLLPLVLDGHTWRFLGTPGADYNDVLCEPGRGRHVVGEAFLAVAALITPSQRCELENISENSVIAAHLSTLPAALRARVQFRRSGPCPTVVFGTRRDEVVGTILTKASLRRHRNKLQRTGVLVFRHMTDRSEVKRHLPDFFREHVMRRAVAGEASVFARPEAREFCQALVDELDPFGELRFGALELNGRPIAYHFGFEARGKFIWYKPTFDVNYWDYSPGEVLTGKLFEYARDRQLDEFDFTRGGEAAKNRFANRVHHNNTLQLYASGVGGWSLHRSHVIRERLKSHRVLFEALKSCSIRAGAWRRYSVNRLRRDGVFGIARKLVTKVMRSAVFARDEVLVFVNGHVDLPLAAESGPGHGVEIRRGSLADLAEVSLDHPEYLDAAGVSRARERLKRGDRVYIARCDGRVAHVNWAGVRTELIASEVGSDLRIPLNPPALIGYDAWTAPESRSKALFTNSLRAILTDAADMGRRCWVYCRAGNRASRRVIEKNGFRLTHRIVRVRILGRTWSRVEDLVNVGSRQSPRGPQVESHVAREGS